MRTTEQMPSEDGEQQPPEDRPKPLGSAKVTALFRQLRRTRHRRTRNRLVKAHLGLAHHIAHRYEERGVAREDLHQVALVGLIKAVDRFDPDHGASFSSFAGRTIEGEIKHYFRDAVWSARVPRSTKNLHLQLRNATDDLRQELGREPTTEDLARHLDVDVDAIESARVASGAFSAAPLTPTERETQSEHPRAVGAPDPQLETVPDRVRVERLIDSLPEREARIVKLRYYRELTQSQIAERVGVSQMHVSRLLRRALSAMRSARRHGERDR